jgi:molybdopterin-containing oxidoreductase family iron-sulfur binding subunit
MESDKPRNSKREFLKYGLLMGSAAAASGIGLNKILANDKTTKSGEKVKVLTTDGKLVEVDKSHLDESCCSITPKEARQGIPGKKFVMVVNLAKCAHALQCQKSCQKHHQLSSDDKWLKVFKMQDSGNSAPYWMPKPCFHCDKPPCVKVCPVDATFKRSDGIVLIDNERCIGCRFCMAACPYSAREFNWGEPNSDTVSSAASLNYSPETSVPRKKGTVEKCDFCPDMLRLGKLPHCVSACPNGVYYFGDINEDTVTNGVETVRFSQLIKDKAGYRYLESLGTDPSVYYLPPVNRSSPFMEDGANDNDQKKS